MSRVRVTQMRLLVRSCSYLVELGLHQITERQNLLVPAAGNVQGQPPDAHRVVGEAGAAVLLEQVEDVLALPKRVEQHSHGPDVHGVRAQPQTMAGDPLQLGENGADVAGPARDLNLHQLLDRLDVAEIARGGRHVVHAVGEQHDLGPVPVLAELLDAPVDVADDAVGLDDALAVQPEHHAEHPVGAGVLRPHVENELVGVEGGAGTSRRVAYRESWSWGRWAVRWRPTRCRRHRPCPLRPADCAGGASPGGSPSGTHPDLRAGSPCAADTLASRRASESGAGRDAQ